MNLFLISDKIDWPQNIHILVCSVYQELFFLNFTTCQIVFFLFMRFCIIWFTNVFLMWAAQAMSLLNTFIYQFNNCKNSETAIYFLYIVSIYTARNPLGYLWTLSRSYNVKLFIMQVWYVSTDVCNAFDLVKEYSSISYAP